MSDVLVKQPSETLPYAIDFTNLIPSGDTLSSVTSVTSTPTGLTVGTPSIDGTEVQFTLAGGTGGVTYRVEAIVVTAGASTIEGDGRLFVTDAT